MKVRFAIAATFLLATAAAARAEDAAPTSVEERLQALEQKHAILERKYEVEQENAANKAKEAASAVAKDGFGLKSTDGNTLIKFSGVVQSDYRALPGVDQFLLRRVRSTVEGTINRNIDFRITPEFAGGFQLLDAYVELKPSHWAKTRFGKFKAPLGLERLQSSANNAFVELGLPVNLVPNYDTGVQLSGDAENGVLSYQFGVFNGVADGTSGETDTSDDKDFVARVFVHPFKLASSDWLNGFGIGVAGSAGNQIGTVATSNLPSFRTNAQQSFFSYASGTFADGERRRLVPQAYWYVGSVGLLGEYALSSQEVTRVAVTTTSATLDNRSYQVALSYVVTGERASFKGVKPRKAFDPATGGWGALELTGRYSELKVDEEAFPRYASLATAASRARAWTGGFNWYLNNNVKLVSNYEYTFFNRGAAAGDRPIERAVLSRIQLTY